MGVVYTNAPGSMSGRLAPFTFDLKTLLTSGGRGNSEVFEMGRYNEMSIMLKTAADWGAAGTIVFQGAPTAEATPVPVRFGAFEDNPLAVQLGVNTANLPCVFLLGARGFGGGTTSTSVSLRGWIPPFMRFFVTTGAGQPADTTIEMTVTLKMY